MADDDVALAVMQEAAALGMVVLAHCENGRAIDLLTRQLVAAGQARPRLAAAQPPDRARGRVRASLPRAGRGRGRDALRRARHRARGRSPRSWRRGGAGMPVYGEVCPHHLRFERARHEGPDALRYVMTPPLRTADDRAALLRGLRDGALDTYASDHCHLRLDRDKLPVAGDFTQVPTGLPGIGARLPLGFAARGRRRGAALARAARRGGLRGAGAHLRAVSAEGRDRRRAAMPTSSSGTRRGRPGSRSQASATGSTGRPTRASRCPGSIRYVLARGDRVVDGRRASPATSTVAPTCLGQPRHRRASPSVDSQYAIQPPSTRTFAPLMYVHSSEARKTASEATSSGWPRRGNGVRACE